MVRQGGVFRGLKCCSTGDGGHSHVAVCSGYSVVNAWAIIPPNVLLYNIHLALHSLVREQYLIKVFLLVDI